MTVTWHVDDLKVSHKSELEIAMFIVYLGKLYGNKIAGTKEMSMIIYGSILTSQKRVKEK